MGTKCRQNVPKHTERTALRVRINEFMPDEDASQGIEPIRKVAAWHSRTSHRTAG